MLVVFLGIQREGIKNNRLVTALNSILNFLLLFIIIGSATFNNDWLAYEELFDGVKPTYDLFYIISFGFFHSLSLTYQDFYLWNQILIFLLLLFFVTRFTSKYLFLVVLAILVLAGPNLSILLRYYTAFAFFLVAIYNLKVSGNRFMGYLFFGLAFISHFGTIILLGIFLVYRYFTIEKTIKPVLAVALGLWFFKEILFGLLISLGIGSFVIYVDEESTLNGGILAALPYFPWMFFVYWQHRKLLKKNNNIKQDSKYIFLYQLSLFPFFFIVLGLFTQIVLHRYIEPFIILWCTFLCYSMRYEEKNLSRFFGGFRISALILVSFYFKYFLPLEILGSSEWLMHYIQILNSNAFELFKINDF